MASEADTYHNSCIAHLSSFTYSQIAIPRGKLSVAKLFRVGPKPGALLPTLAGALSLILLMAACNGDDEPTTAPPQSVTPATATPTWTPEPIATPTPTTTPTPVVVPDTTALPQTDDGDGTQAVISTKSQTYTDDLYGYALRVPEMWTAERPQSGLPSIATVFETSNDDISAQTLVLFSEEPVSAAEIAQQQLTPLAGLSGFRTITESDHAVEDSTEAHQVLYGYGTGLNEQRGSITFVTRGTLSVGIQTQAPRNIYERNFDVLDGVSTSIHPVDPQPFGTPRDDTLILYLDTGPLTLDPGVATDAQSAQYIRQIFSGLVRLDENLLAQADLATWDVSDDGTVYTFTIRENAQFHNGEPVTAQHVIFSWERALNRNLPPVGGSADGYLDDIIGAEQYAAGQADSITGLEAVDDDTLIVTIDEPKSYFIAKLTHPSTYVVLESNVPAVPQPRLREDDKPADDAEEKGAANGENAQDGEPPALWYHTAIGTGPYRLAHYERSRAAHLSAFEGYVGPTPTVGNLVFRFHAGRPTAMVEEGFVDATTLISSQTYTTLQEEESLLIRNITVSNALSIQYLAFNTTVAPFNDPDVRRAFLWAVDRKSLLAEHFGQGGRLASGFMPPGLPGYDEGIADIPYDPVAAKELLNSTDYGKMRERPAIILATAGEAVPFLRAVKKAWQENLGVRIIIRPYGPTYFYMLPQIIEDGATIYSYGWLADYPDPHNFLDTLFHTQSPHNDGKAGSEAIDELLEQARTAGDDRLDQYREIERRMVKEAVAIPLYFDQNRLLVSDRVSNLTLDSQGFLKLETVTLDPKNP